MGGTRQMLFVIASIALLSQISLTVDNYITGNSEASLMTEATITATGLAHSMLREVVKKGFDEKVLSKSVSVADSLTAVGSLGPEAGETIPDFDDIDDYQQYERLFSSPRLGSFRIRTGVWYVSKDDLNSVSPYRTFYKRVKVTVDQNPSLEFPVTSSRVVSY